MLKLCITLFRTGCSSGKLSFEQNLVYFPIWQHVPAYDKLLFCHNSVDVNGGGNGDVNVNGI